MKLLSDYYDGRDIRPNRTQKNSHATVWFDRTLCIKLILGKVWYSLLVLIFGLCRGIATFPLVGPCRGHGTGMGTWSFRADKPATGQTWGSRGAERRDTPSKRRTVRKLEGVSRLLPKMRSSSSFQTETCRPGTVHTFVARHPDRWDRDDGCYRIRQCGNRID